MSLPPHLILSFLNMLSIDTMPAKGRAEEPNNNQNRATSLKKENNPMYVTIHKWCGGRGEFYSFILTVVGVILCLTNNQPEDFNSSKAKKAIALLMNETNEYAQVHWTIYFIFHMLLLFISVLAFDITIPGKYTTWGNHKMEDFSC